VGYQALMANALLTSSNALGYVTELLSGDFNTPFGRSSHVQTWSEAMVVTPVLRGLFGLEARDRGQTLEIAPALPADWNEATVRRFPVGQRRLDVAIRRASGATEIAVTPAAGDVPAGTTRLDLAPAFPLDARIVEVRADGKPVAFEVDRLGEVQRVRASVALGARPVTIRVASEGGTDVFVRHERPTAGARSEGVRVVRARASADALDLVVEGVAGRTYELGVRGRTVGASSGIAVAPRADATQSVRVTFEGVPGTYVRREMRLPLVSRPAPAGRSARRSG
jgi:hypothetical protein